MAGFTTFNIRGNEKAQKMLEAFADQKTRRRIVSAAVRAGNTVVRKKARALSPPPRTGRLKKSIKGSVRYNRVSGTVVGRVRSKNLRYGHLVLRGTDPHKIYNVVLNGRFYRVVRHPGATPKPFIEQAYWAVNERAVDAFWRKYSEKYDQEWIKAKSSGGK